MSAIPELIRANLSLEGIEQHDHVALFYKDDSERDRLCARLINNAYERNEQVVITASDDDLPGLARNLKDIGRRMEDLLSSGSIRLLIFHEGCEFDHDEALRRLEGAIKEGKANGFQGVRIINYASSLGRWWSNEGMMTVESLSNEIYEEMAGTGICLWHINDPMAMQVVARHPFLIIRGFLCRNYFYMSPDELAKDRHIIPFGQVFLDRLLDIQMHELSINSNDESLRDINKRLAEEMEQRQRVEWALVQSENNYRNALNAMADMVHVIDRDGTVVLANHVFIDKVRQLGYQGNVVGDQLSNILPFIGLTNMEDNERVFATGRSLKREETLHLDGQEVCIEVRKIPVMNGSHAYNVLTISREVEQKKLA